MDPGSRRIDTPAIPMLAGNSFTEAPRVVPPQPTRGFCFSN
jgi:hypothetical protein